MPFDKEQSINGGVIGLSEYDAPPPAFLDKAAAALRQGNMIVSNLSSARPVLGPQATPRLEPGYNPFDDIAGYEEYADRFEEAYNPQETEVIKLQIDQELKDRATLAASGWTGVFLQILAAGLDLPTLIPGGALIRSGKIGLSGIKSAASVGVAAGVGTAVQEAGLHTTQETRTGAESALAIGGATLLGGVIGFGAAKFMSKAEWDRLGANLKAELQAENVPDPTEVTQTLISRMQSAGAAAIDDVSLEDLGVGGPKAAQAVARATAAARLNPGIQTLFSPSRTVRQVYQQMVDNPVYTKMEMEHRTLGPAVENTVKELQRGALARWIKETRSLWKEARKAGFEGRKIDFMARVSAAGRRGDVDPLGNEYVTKSAQLAREAIFDPTLARAKQAGLLPDDVKTTTSASYVTRFWNRQKLIGEETRFREIARGYFRQEVANLPKDAAPDFVSKADFDDYVEEAVTSVFNNLTGRGQGDIPEWIVPVSRGPLKERSFRIDDALIEDFLENDMEAVLRRYVRTMGAETELAAKFGRADLRDQFEAIGKEYDDLSAKAKTGKERLKLAKARDRDIQNLEAFRDMIRGTYRAAEDGSDWSRLTRAALTWNYIRLLGGVLLTSMTDASRLVAVHGLRATMREALPNLVSRLKAANISRQDARDLGAVTEVVLQSRLATLAELQDPYAFGSPYERFLSNTSNVFSKMTGLGWWNDTMKTMASVMTQNRMARASLNWNGAGKKERAYMAFLGIDQGMAGRIARQLGKHGIEERGIWGANVSRWDDDVARRVWAAALNKDVDRTIITKGVADTPLWTKTNWGKLISQFKSFGLASHQRALIAGLQENPLRLLEGMIFSASLGMLIGYLKFVEKGDFESANRLLDNPGLMVSEGLDRSGYLSIPFDISNTAEKIGLPFGIKTGLQTLAGDEDQSGSVSRYASRNPFGAVLGPSAGLFKDLATIASKVSKGDLTTGGANAMIRQVPFGSLPGVRSGLHGFVKPQFQDAVN